MALKVIIAGSRSVTDFETVKKAIEQYEANVEDDDWGIHPYKRLVIIYRRLKLYDDEIRIINAAIKAFSKHGYYREVDAFKKRLVKAETLKERKWL